MLQADHCETMLGRLGAFLAAQDLHQIEIVDEGAFLVVSWQPADAARQHRCFDEADVARLRPSPERGCQESSSRAALLGTLGQEIDRAQLDVAHIVEEADGFVVSGTRCGTYLHRRYRFPELEGNGAQPPARPGGPAPSILSRIGGGVPTAPIPMSMLVAAPNTHESPLRHRLQLIP